MYGKLLYDNPASVPETKAPAKTVVNKRSNEIKNFFYVSWFCRRLYHLQLFFSLNEYSKNSTIGENK